MLKNADGTYTLTANEVAVCGAGLHQLVTNTRIRSMNLDLAIQRAAVMLCAPNGTTVQLPTDPPDGMLTDEAFIDAARGLIAMACDEGGL